MKRFVLCAVLFAVASSAVTKDGNCPEVYCYSYCTTGYLLDENGCTSCSCQAQKVGEEPVCEKRQCFMPCDTGYRLDAETRCMTCMCAPPETVEPHVHQGALGLGTGSGPGACNRIRCLVPCRKGYRLDSQGCPSCVCSDDTPGSKGAGEQLFKPASSGASAKKTGLPDWIRNMFNRLYRPWV